MQTQPGSIAVVGERRRPSPKSATVDRSSPESATAAAIAENGGGCPGNIAKPGEHGHPGTRNPEPGTQRGYFGSKAGAGVWQQIINQIPPCDVFIEAFAGSATITRRMRPAPARIVIDNDPAAYEALTAVFADEDRHAGNGDDAGVTVICADAISWLEQHRSELNARTVIYCDPPYLFDVRSGGRRKRYAKELGEQWSHASLLALLGRLTNQGVKILLSGYRSSLYSAILDPWRRIDYRAMTRGGPRTESLWCNFPEPAELHDYRFAGDGFRDRERLKRKKARWTAKLAKMPAREVAALLDAIDEWRRRRSPQPTITAGIARTDVEGLTPPTSPAPPVSRAARAATPRTPLC